MLVFQITDNHFTKSYTLPSFTYRRRQIGIDRKKKLWNVLFKIWVFSGFSIYIYLIAIAYNSNVSNVETTVNKTIKLLLNA